MVCMDEKDTSALASFMLKRAREASPGQDVSIELQVNCTEGGGSNIVLGA